MRAHIYFLAKYLLTLCLSTGLTLEAAVPGDTLKVLFVGNSYTYYQNLPQIISLISDSTGSKLETRKSTAGGASLAHHWNGERGLKTKEYIESGNFDLVIIQDYSLGPVDQPEQFIKYATLFCELVREKGAIPYLFVTWAREKVPQHQEILNSAYERIAVEQNAIILPAGPGWTLARQLRPGVPLYAADGSHPSDLGTFLTACIFVRKITGELPDNLPRRYYTKDLNQESIELLRMDDLDIKFCTKIAREVIEGMDVRSVETGEE